MDKKMQKNNEHFNEQLEVTLTTSRISHSFLISRYLISVDPTSISIEFLVDLTT